MEPQPSDHGRPPNTRDLACGGVSILLWIVPAIILAVTAIHGGPYLVVGWPVLLTFMGAACLLNAKRCGRLHCFVTGPFLLLLAGLSLLCWLRVSPVRPRGWPWLVRRLLVCGQL